ncbi:MAG: zf-TFIIB domain-containing protein [Pirellulales bacterium]|nr:zf-TFIIB domain-containing protein [Pirellulales bacterium]
MKCPLCNVELKRILYEGLPVLRCMKCHGYLMSRNRMEGIRRVAKRPVEQLKQETTAEAQPDTQEAIRCPRCRRKMKKHFLEDPVSLHLDVCADCEFLWLDGGELARIQLGHQISPQGRESTELQRRVQERTPGERAQLQRDIDALPDDDWSLLSCIRQGAIEALFTRRRGW